MDRELLNRALAPTLDGRRLLDHPFYQRWSMGQVSRDELRQYAAQYRHFERMIPGLLEGIAATASTEEGKKQALVNLADEAGSSPTHAELFEQFAGALDAPAQAPSPAMTALLQTYASALEAGAAEGFAALWSYEAQAPEVTASKSHGLRTHYGMTEGETTFWDVHARVDEDHARWAVDAIASMTSDAGSATRWARAAAQAWWDFLTEREALSIAA